MMSPQLPRGWYRILTYCCTQEAAERQKAAADKARAAERAAYEAKEDELHAELERRAEVERDLRNQKLAAQKAAEAQTRRCNPQLQLCCMWQSLQLDRCFSRAGASTSQRCREAEDRRRQQELERQRQEEEALRQLQLDRERKVAERRRIQQLSKHFAITLEGSVTFSIPPEVSRTTLARFSRNIWEHAAASHPGSTQAE